MIEVGTRFYYIFEHISLIKDNQITPVCNSLLVEKLSSVSLCCVIKFQLAENSYITKYLVLFCDPNKASYQIPKVELKKKKQKKTEVTNTSIKKKKDFQKASF